MNRQLIRTYPTITGNIKISISRDNVYLTTINSTNNLNRNNYKYIKRPNSGNFIDDLKNFYNTIQSTDMYSIVEESLSESIRNDFNDQYSTIYDAGLRNILSLKVPERLSIFAPIYFNNTNDFPNSYHIFKVPEPDIKRKPTTEILPNKKYRYFGDHPMEYGNNLIDNDSFLVTDDVLLSYSIPSNGYLIEDKSTLDNITIEEILDKSKLVQSFDLSNIPYITNTLNYPDYPNKPYYVNFDNQQITIYGIDYMNGSINQKSISISKFIDSEYQISEFDRFISNLYTNNNLIYPNILNIEFLFDDPDDGFHRYYGFYGNLDDKATFNFDSLKFSNDYNLNLFNENSLPLNRNSLITSDDNVIISPTDVIDGNLPIDVIDENVISFIRSHNSVIKVNNRKDPLTMVNGGIKIGDLINYDGIINIESYAFNSPSKAYVEISVTDQFKVGDSISILRNGKTYMEIIADDLKDYKQLPYDPYNTDYVEGTNVAYYFYPFGDIESISNAIINAIKWLSDDMSGVIDAIYHDGKIIIYHSTHGIQGNLFSITANTSSLNFTNEIRFSGGTDFSDNNITLKTDNLPDLSNLYVLTNDGYEKVISINKHFEIINNNLVFYDEYLNITINDSKTSILVNNTKATLLLVEPLKFSLLNVSPISELDFDFDSDTYNLKYESEYFRYFKVRKLEVGVEYTIYKNSDTVIDPIISHNGIQYTVGDSFTSITNNFDILDGDPIIIANSHFNDEEVISFTGFVTLNDGQSTYNYDNPEEKYRSLIKPTSNEYSRFKDNQFNTTENKIHPNIFKFAIIGGGDVRDNPYRLNLSSVFGNNFTPGFDSINQNPNFFTHEWLYLSGKPHDFDLNNNFPYFNSTIDEDTIINDGFDDYFESNFITYNDNGVIKKYYINPKLRYSEVEKDDNGYFVFFRGVRIKLIGKPFDGYRFSSILVFTKSTYLSPNKPVNLKLIENSNQKFVLLIVYVNIEDYKVLPNLNEKHLYEYSYLYMMNSLKRYESNQFKFGIFYDFPPLSNNVSLYDGGVGISGFRGVQLYGKVDLSLTDLQNRMTFETNSLIELSIKLIDGELDRLVAMSDDTFIGFTNQNFRINDTSYEINADNTLLSFGKDYIDLLPNGIGVYNILNQVAGNNYSPIILNDTIYPISNATWFYRNGGKDFYEDYASLLSFSSIVDGLKNGLFEMIGDNITLNFIEPSEITINKSLELVESSVISPKNPSKSITTYDVINNDTSFKIKRYNGFYDLLLKDIFLPAYLNIDKTWLSFNLITWEEYGRSWESEIESIPVQNWDISDAWEEIDESFDSFEFDIDDVNKSKTLYDENYNFGYDVSKINQSFGKYCNKVSLSSIGYEGTGYLEIDDIHLFKKETSLNDNTWSFGYLNNWITLSDNSLIYGTYSTIELPILLMSKNLNVNESFSMNPSDFINISGNKIIIDYGNLFINHIYDLYHQLFDGYIFDWETMNGKEQFIRDYINENIYDRYMIKDISVYTSANYENNSINIIQGNIISFINNDMINNKNIDTILNNREITITVPISNIGINVGISINSIHI